MGARLALPAYMYVGNYERNYGGRAVRPGDVVELDSPPAGYEFIPAVAVPAEPAPESPESPAGPVSPPPVPEAPPAPVEPPAAPMHVNPNTQPPAYVH
jgi:hypothetical protein